VKSTAAICGDSFELAVASPASNKELSFAAAVVSTDRSSGLKRTQANR
jgi:hypothetical protein